MKTNQIMIRDDNRFVQRTKDGYFNATVLLNNWNFKNFNKKKDITKYKRNKGTLEFIEQLKGEGIEKPYISSNKGTWMHPKLFIDFAMWLSVEFKSIVIDYVLDGLIKTRNDAGDYYNEMTAVILDVYVSYYNRKPPAYVYINEARLVKSLVTDPDKPRNEMTEQELSNITQLQKFNSLLLKKRIGKVARIKQLKIMAEALNL